MRRRAAIGIFLALGLLLGACGSDSGAGGECDDEDACAPEPQELPEPQQEDYTTIKTKDGHFRFEPISSPVKQGTEYIFSIHTHCGLDVAVVDFDGAFWDYVGPDPQNGSGNPPEGFANPSDEGRMLLENHEQAKFTSSMGAPAYFERHEGAKTFPGCM